MALKTSATFTVETNDSLNSFSMKYSFDWLSEYLELPPAVHVQDVADKLLTHTVEVEEVITPGESLQNIVVGKVTNVKKHENADSLNVCQVDVGDETLQVVCGGSNVREGMKVAMGKIGAKVRWHGEGELVELVKAKIRGEVSFGMICASDEIGLGDVFQKKEEKEILDLSHLDATVGTPLVDALGLKDSIIDVDNKSMTHRPDLWGHYGMARDAAAALSVPLKPYGIAALPEDGENTVGVDIKTDNCRRASFIKVDNVTVADSPDWLKARLAAVGLRPINNIVDITNYVMYDLGQPMHAHDTSKLDKPEMTIRQAKKGEKFTALVEEKEYELTDEDIVISSGKTVVALAGVMGSKESDIDASTTSVVLEAANFDAMSVRRTGTRHGLRSDASTRFEKSLDPELTVLALSKAVDLLKQCCPEATVSSALADAYPAPYEVAPISIRHDFLIKKVGADISPENVVDTLERLGFGVAEQGGEYTVTVPSWRATKDVSIKEDIVEEVARMYGYNNIDVNLPAASIEVPPENHLRDLEIQVKRELALTHAASEVYSYSFVSPEWITKTGERVEDYIELDNPVAKDRPYVRRYLVTNLLQMASDNLHRYDGVKLFEIGKVFRKDETGLTETPETKETLPGQDLYLAIVVAEKGNDTPFMRAKHMALETLASAGIHATCEQDSTNHALVHPGRHAKIMAGGEVIGHIGEVHPAKMEELDLPHRTAIVEVNLEKALTRKTTESSYKPLPQYPGVERDIAFVIDSDVQHADVLAKLETASPLIARVSLFDVYQGEHVPEGKKSMAYRIMYRSDKETLKAKDVDTEHEKVREMLQKKFGAEVRS